MAIHNSDREAIESQHGQVTDRINDMLIQFQDTAYEQGLARGKAEAMVQRDNLVAALKEARSTIATALKANAPDWFKTDEDVASHLTVKRIDAAIAEAAQ